MIWTLAEHIATVAEAFLAANFIVRYNGCKSRKYFIPVLTLITILTAGCTFLMNSLTIFEGVYSLFFVVIWFLCGFLLLEGRISEKLFSSIISIILISVINMAVLTLFSSILDRNVSELITDRNIFRCLILFITKFLYFLATYAVLGIKNKLQNRLNLLEWIMIILIFLTSLIVGLFIFEFAFQFELSGIDHIFLNTAVISIVIINVITFYLFTMLNKRHNELLQFSKLQVQVAQQSKSLNDLKELSLEMRKIRHDMTKYLDITSNLISSGKSEEALRYLEKIQTEKIDHTFHPIITSSDVINALLNTKFSYCKKHGIDFVYQITANVSTFSEMDLSVLLGNLLDNAIEAAEKCEQPFVKITICESKAYLVVIVTNSIGASVLKENPDFKTTKKDQLHHGLGLLTVKDIVEKYDGIFNIDEEGCSILVDVRLKLNTAKKGKF
ncbi:MAG: GHKL domain-containing protein [Oscillospiraceae bacterium]|nr:GHKL domain-containing protein [Oscillospiraceae bacterium]